MGRFLLVRFMSLQPDTVDWSRDLVEAGRHMEIAVHDHVIVSASGRTSMKALGLI